MSRYLSQRAWGYLVSLGLIGAVLWPLQQAKPKDSFPLSTYPMFSRKRPSEVSIDHVVGVGASGRQEAIPPRFVASGEVLQAKITISQKLKRGRKGALELCKQVAARLADEEAYGWVERVEVRSDRYLVVGYFSGARKPIWSRRHASCPVGSKADSSPTAAPEGS
jgi:hypothetical protein